MIYPNDLGFCDNGDLVVSNVLVNGKYYDAVIERKRANANTQYTVDQIARIKQHVQEIYKREKTPLKVGFSLLAERYLRIVGRQRYFSSDRGILQNLQKMNDIFTHRVIGMELQDKGESMFLNAQPYTPKKDLSDAIKPSSRSPARHHHGPDFSGDKTPKGGSSSEEERESTTESVAEAQSAAKEEPPAQEPVPSALLKTDLYSRFDAITYGGDKITLDALRKYALRPYREKGTEIDNLYRSYLKLLADPNDDKEKETLCWFQELYKKAYEIFKNNPHTAATAVVGFIKQEDVGILELVKKLKKTVI